MSTSSDARVRHYAQNRYRGLDQRLVNALESRLIHRCIDRLGSPGDRVLDMPCGYGRFTASLAERGLEVTAGDLKPGMLRLLAERLDERVDALQVRGDALPFPDDHFDFSVCVRLFQHLRDPEVRRNTLCELARVSRRGVIATIYVESGLHRAVHRLRRQKRLKYYTDETLRADLAAAGLRASAMWRPLPGLHSQRVLQLEPAPAASVANPE